MKKNYTFKSKVIVYPGANAWRFMVLPQIESEKIRRDFKKVERGWNSHRVEAIIGKTVWETSIFYDRRNGAYLLPLKAQVRKKEQIDDGDTVSFSVKIKD